MMNQKKYWNLMMNNFIKNHLEILEKNNFSYPEIELRTLLNKTSKSKKEIIFSNFEIKQIRLDLFNIAFERRLKKEPVAKIFNEKEFLNYNFFVNNDVLDPRPETEFIIEAFEKYFIDKKQKLNIIDLGTGSGCIAISLAKEYINSIITANDISENALNVAKRNAKKFNIGKQIKFICCDWIDIDKVYDVIVSNPPYLTISEYKNISKEIINYEPEIALIGGKDGLSCYRKLANKFPKITHSNSLCFIEIGHSQKTESIKIFEEFGMDCIDIIVDYQNYERILVLKKKLNKY